ncbi:MAG TPA: HAMP domain-containing sensor histidine kinase [Candidatus Paceibacterota bacterium]
MNAREFILKFHLGEECKKYGTPLWQCPQFLFVIMGLLIIISVIFSFVLGERYIRDPQITLIFILALTGVLLSIAFTITRSFEQLAEANRMKTEFISIVSHQLRSPLTNLKWGLDYLMTEGKMQQTKEEAGYFQILKENVGRMHEMINDLLTVSRAEQGRLPFEEQEFSLEEIIKAVLLEFHSSAVASNVEIKIEAEKAPKLWSDPSLVRHVLSNLVDNAIRYAWRGMDGERGRKKERSRIVIRYFQTGAKIRCEVEDNGVGIPQQDQRFIFRKFFRSGNAVRHQTEGSGLGLYIVKSLLERAGGQIGFESEENKGSTFWFTLPIKPS